MKKNTYAFLALALFSTGCMDKNSSPASADAGSGTDNSAKAQSLSAAQTLAVSSFRNLIEKFEPSSFRMDSIIDSGPKFGTFLLQFNDACDQGGSIQTNGTLTQNELDAGAYARQVEIKSIFSFQSALCKLSGYDLFSSDLMMSSDWKFKMASVDSDASLSMDLKIMGTITLETATSTSDEAPTAIQSPITISSDLLVIHMTYDFDGKPEAIGCDGNIMIDGVSIACSQTAIVQALDNSHKAYLVPGYPYSGEADGGA